MPEPILVELYSRRNCHLCELALANLETYQIQSGRRLNIKVLDVDSDLNWQAQFGDKVPVTFINGELFDYYAIDLDDFANKITKMESK